MTKRSEGKITTGGLGCGIFEKVVAELPFFVVTFHHHQIGNPGLIHLASPGGWVSSESAHLSVRDNALIHLGVYS